MLGAKSYEKILFEEIGELGSIEMRLMYTQKIKKSYLKHFER